MKAYGSFPELIKDYIRTQGMTQSEFAELRRISEDAVKSWSSGRRSPSVKLLKLALPEQEWYEEALRVLSDGTEAKPDSRWTPLGMMGTLFGMGDEELIRYLLPGRKTMAFLTGQGAEEDTEVRYDLIRSEHLNLDVQTLRTITDRYSSEWAHKYDPAEWLISRMSPQMAEQMAERYIRLLSQDDIYGKLRYDCSESYTDNPRLLIPPESSAKTEATIPTLRAIHRLCLLGETMGSVVCRWESKDGGKTVSRELSTECPAELGRWAYGSHDQGNPQYPVTYEGLLERLIVRNIQCVRTAGDVTEWETKISTRSRGIACIDWYDKGYRR